MSVLMRVIQQEFSRHLLTSQHIQNCKQNKNINWVKYHISGKQLLPMNLPPQKTVRGVMFTTLVEASRDLIARQVCNEQNLNSKIDLHMVLPPHYAMPKNLIIISKSYMYTYTAQVSTMYQQGT